MIRIDTDEKGTTIVVGTTTTYRHYELPLHTDLHEVNPTDVTKPQEWHASLLFPSLCITVTVIRGIWNPETTCIEATPHPSRTTPADGVPFPTEKPDFSRLYTQYIQTPVVEEEGIYAGV